ncbi:MAG: hypothetical protein N2513_10120 [Deltaproteobacteria bacterium]|nr:hypothetical protein [Deltaproteobacteria bacterium]
MLCKSSMACPVIVAFDKWGEIGIGVMKGICSLRTLALRVIVKGIMASRDYLEEEDSNQYGMWRRPVLIGCILRPHVNGF